MAIDPMIQSVSINIRRREDLLDLVRRCRLDVCPSWTDVGGEAVLCQISGRDLGRWLAAARCLQPPRVLTHTTNAEASQSLTLNTRGLKLRVPI